MQPKKHPIINDRNLRPLLKWPGGKARDFGQILKNHPYVLPLSVNSYYEPFLGGGAVWLQQKSEDMHVNDLSNDLMRFYRLLDTEGFQQRVLFIAEMWRKAEQVTRKHFAKLYEGDITPFIPYNTVYPEHNYLLTNTFSGKIKRIKKHEAEKGQLSEADAIKNVEGAIKAAIYTVVRKVYNTTDDPHEAAATFYVVRQYCYSSMFRFDKDGNFNVPYGGISYNARQPDADLEYWNSTNLREHFFKTTFHCNDFETFLDDKPKDGDWIFVDRMTLTSPRMTRTRLVEMIRSAWQNTCTGHPPTSSPSCKTLTSSANCMTAMIME
jgi:DNA adenine methylase